MELGLRNSIIVPKYHNSIGFGSISYHENSDPFLDKMTRFQTHLKSKAFGVIVDVDISSCSKSRCCMKVDCVQTIKVYIESALEEHFDNFILLNPLKVVLKNKLGVCFLSLEQLIVLFFV